MSNKLIFRKHALKRMFLRSIRVDDVRAVLSGGKSIIDYPDDTPYSSRLMGLVRRTSDTRRRRRHARK